ncbi:tumor necrosis factor receptor superfamily member 6B-like [Nelusetta ayraudi]|uniref:tumor necrosis factor receptor superfamily member 6B-like n=1 Tax=Nelusetta ayraudi TaxID=303726 RepID=UPI003F72516B
MTMLLSSPLRLLFLHLLLLLLPPTPSLSQSAAPTFWFQDRATGERLQCSSCPPGTYLSAGCSAGRSSQCSPCPPGFFTELWNHISRCLRCSTCGGAGEEAERPCSAQQDSRCRCRPGFYYRHQAGMCHRHSSCPIGHSVLLNGTATEDTRCQLCPAGTFSSASSAQSVCLSHRLCGSTQLQLLNGTTWHDSVCSSPGGSQDAAYYLRDMLPAFFLHQNIPGRRLRLLLHHMSGGGAEREHSSGPAVEGVSERITEWLVHTATAEDIWRLPELLRRARLQRAADRLEKKLQQVKARLEEHLEGGAEGRDQAGGAPVGGSRGGRPGLRSTCRGKQRMETRLEEHL